MQAVRRIVFLCSLAALGSSLLFSQAKAPEFQSTPPSTTTTSGSFLTTLERRTVIQQARRSYYNLKSEGLLEFHFQVVPDWDSMYKQLPVDAVGREELLLILKNVRFLVIVGPNGASTISHQSDVAPPSENVANRVRTSISGMEQMITGVLQTWSTFSYAIPFPEADSDYQIEDLGTKYRLTSKEGPVDIRISMTRDFAIEELGVGSSEFSGNIHPKLAPTKGGLIMTSYDAMYKSGSGAPAQVSATIQNSEVDGILLPESLSMTTTLPTGRVLTVQATLTDRKLKKR